VTTAADARVLVSIINYRTAEMTIRCVGTVLSELEGLTGTVVVVDNASGDGSADLIEAWIADRDLGSRVRLIRSERNTGFSGGHNIGIGAGEAELYLVLNSDAEVRPGFFRAMLAAAGARPEAGLFAPAIEREDGSVQDSCFRFPTPVSEFIRGANSGPVTKALARWTVSLGSYPAEADIRWASFACILLRAAMVREIGPLDEGYFMYFEDIDYCREARRRGWRIARVPEARALHLQGGSGPVKKLSRARKRLPAYYYASRSRFFYRSYGRAGLVAPNMAWGAVRLLAQTRRLFGVKVHSAAEGEGRDIWINAARPLGPRHAPGDAA
jgi:N-acetylglucosaminyl-diphospho-decaprenol L-rhamnosyltransferase